MKKYLSNISLRRLFSLVLVLVLTITLTSCSNTYNRNPIGMLPVDETYAKIGDTKLSVGELWSELRYSTSNKLDAKITSIILEKNVSEITNVLNGADSATKTDYQNRLRDFAIKAIFGISDVKNLSDLTSNQKKIAAQKYVSNLFINNPVYVAKANAGKTIDINDFLTNDDYSSVYEYFYEDLAKELFALEKLNKEIEEHDANLKNDEDPYFSNSEILNYYKNNFVNVGDFKGIMIRFVNETELNNTLKAFGIKVFKNAWYYVPGENKTFTEYSKYYDKLEIKANNLNTTEYEPLTGYSEAAIIQLYIEMYNFIYTYRSALPNTPSIFASSTLDHRKVTNSILTNDVYEVSDLITLIGNNEYVNYSAKQLNDIDSSLKTYIYETLTYPNQVLKDGQTSTNYTTTGRSYAYSYYLIYKLSVESDSYTDVITTDNDGEEYIDKNSNSELVNKIIDGLKKDTLIDSYISNAFTEAKKDIKVQIYDTILEITYSIANSDYSKTHKKAPDKNTLAKITYDGNDYFYKVDEAYNELESVLGSTTAIDLISKKVLKNTDFYKNISKDDEKAYNENLKTTLAMFANDQLSQYGYPSSIGKYNFMLLYYRSANVKDIIDNFYKINASLSKCIYDYENEALLNEFIYFTEKAVTNYMNISATNLLVYVDMNEDGVADKDYVWSSSLESKANELIDKIINQVEASNAPHSQSLQTIISKYNSSARFSNGICTPNSTEYDPTSPECTWAEYRSLGLFVKTQDYSDIKNINDVSTVSEILKNRLYEIYTDESFITNDVISTQFIDYDQKGLKTSEGLNLLFITKAALSSSFEYTLDDNVNAKYFFNIPLMYNDKKVIISDILSNNGSISLNQVKVYLYEYLSSSDVQLIPSELVGALGEFLTPVLSRYTSSATQRELLINFLSSFSNSNITFTNTANNTRFENIRIINKNLEDNYLSETDIANNFGGWWTRIVTGGNK